MSQGVIVFKTIAEALREGYVVHDRSEEPPGYIVKKKGPGGWEQALVVPNEGG